MTHQAYLSLGSNLGDRAENCSSAVKELEGSTGIKVVLYSSLYETAPVGFEDQPPFINMALKIETTLKPGELLEKIKHIEKKLGRVESFKWGPRAVDIDILLYDSEIISEKDLEIPHPRMHEREFTLIPLAEIGGDVKHPLRGKTISEIAAGFPVSDAVRRMVNNK